MRLTATVTRPGIDASPHPTIWMPGGASSGTSSGRVAGCTSRRPATTPRPVAAHGPGTAPMRPARADGHDWGCQHRVFPNLITYVVITDATVIDNQMTEPIHDALAAKHLTPARHYTDSGYLSAVLVVAALARHSIALVGPFLADCSAQAVAHGARHRGLPTKPALITSSWPAG